MDGVFHKPSHSNGAADYLSRTFDEDAQEAANLAAIFAEQDIAATASSDSGAENFNLMADALLHTDYASATAYDITQDQLHILLLAQQASWNIDEQSELFAANFDYDKVNAILDESTSTHLAALTRSQK